MSDDKIVFVVTQTEGEEVYNTWVFSSEERSIEKFIGVASSLYDVDFSDADSVYDFRADDEFLDNGFFCHVFWDKVIIDMEE